MMKKNLRYSTERVKALRTPATPSEFISGINNLKPGLVVLYVRVSANSQDENLPHQINRLKTELEKRGFKVIAIYSETEPGWRDRRIGFERAIDNAQSAGAVVVAESVDRYRKSWVPDWNDRKRQRRLSVFDVKRLMAEADGVPL